MHDPMSDADQPLIAELHAQQCDEVVERALVTQLDAVAPGLLVEGLIFSILGNETGRCVEPLGLAAGG